MKHPRWCLQFISPKEIREVSEAVKSAEEKTTGEIIPMIVKRSSALGHLGFQIFTIAALCATLLYLALEKTTDLAHPSWIAMAVIVVMMPVSEWLARSKHIQRLFAISNEQNAQVNARAFHEFYTSGFQKTKGHTGVLIFLSIMERKCVVLADEGIASKLPPETWKLVVDQIIAGIKKGKTAEGLMAGIQECGHILTRHFPLNGNGKHENEISNQLIVKD